MWAAVALLCYSVISEKEPINKEKEENSRNLKMAQTKEETVGFIQPAVRKFVK